MLMQVQIDRLCDLIEYLVNNGFSDMSDASAEISFMDYGMLRNPKTNQVIYCMPVDADYKEIMLDWSIISIEDVKEYLKEDATDSFYSFVGSTKEQELKGLDNNYLSSIIQAINQYDGNFQQSCLWNYDTETIKTILN
ncbi:hypothetical protein KAR91_78710 [Candidatus Pacearchaeota archaeon]|nr:hypothetical protein [Candidatus Pacearchaeota archaeon]